MRNVVHAARFLILGFLLATGLPLAGASAQEIATRVIVTPDADYPGFDYETVKNVDLNACQAACIDGDQCRAFTYNTKARWCFLKTDFGTLTATPGATAGRLVQTAELTPSLETTRLAQLDFVPGRYVDEARELAGSIKRRYFPPAGSAYQQLRDMGTEAYNAGNYDGAATLFGQTLALADDNPGLWMDFAIASLGREPDDWTAAPAGLPGRHRGEHQCLRPLRHGRQPGEGARAARRRLRPPRGVEALLPLLPRQPCAGRGRRRPERLREGHRRARLPHRLPQCRFGHRRAAHLRRLLRRPAGLRSRA